MKNKVLSVFVVMCLIISMILPVYAETRRDYEIKINNANKDLDKLEGQIDETLDEIEKISTEISTLETQIKKLETELDTLETSIKEKEDELKEKQELLDERLVAMYMAGETSYLNVLLSGGFVDFISNYYLITQIAEYDTNLINQVEDIKTGLENEKQEVETKREELNTKKSSLTSAKGKKQLKLNNLTAEQKEKQTQIDAWNKKMEELAEAERRARQEESGTIKYSGGPFQWPVPASKRITSYYGYRIHPIYKTYKLHTGIDIGASTGCNIIAAESGKVILASYGYNGGYGNYIIINHGSGITTRYAHCNSLSVKEGQTVTKGQVIGTVGTTGASTGPHLHFEVRSNGESTDPLKYL